VQIFAISKLWSEAITAAGSVCTSFTLFLNRCSLVHSPIDIDSYPLVISRCTIFGFLFHVYLCTRLNYHSFWNDDNSLQRISTNKGPPQQIFQSRPLDQWYSTLFVRVPPDIISLQLFTPKVVGAYFKLYKQSQ
jgi:hypothetical protein